MLAFGMMLLQLAWHGLFEALACTASSSAHHLAAGVAINAGELFIA